MSRALRSNNESAGDATVTVLLVEPSRLMRKVLSTVCASRGIATRSRSEVGAALSSIVKNRPTAVLAAFELPGLSGVALIAALKSSPYHRAIPIGLVTSSDSVSQHLSVHRPDTVIRRDDNLSGAVTNFLESFSIGQERALGQKAGGGELKGKILLAEDSTVIQKLLAKMLHVAGADVMLVENGAQAVAAASEQRFDLILMDIEMPEMDGLEAVRVIRSKGISVPVVAATAHDAESFRSEAVGAGFDDVLTKPAERQVLIETCRRHLIKP